MFSKPDVERMMRKPATRPEVTVVLLTYNEKSNILKLVPRIETVFNKMHTVEDILVIDDSSSDGTADAARKLGNKYRNVRVIVKRNKEGLGAALRTGYNAARGEITLSMDFNLSVDPKSNTTLCEPD